MNTLAVVIVMAATLAVLFAFLFVFGRRPARTWIVDQAADLPGLEQRLNYLEEHTFRPWRMWR